jgi:hypothetical protein
MKIFMSCKWNRISQIKYSHGFLQFHIFLNPDYSFMETVIRVRRPARPTSKRQRWVVAVMNHKCHTRYRNGSDEDLDLPFECKTTKIWNRPSPPPKYARTPSYREPTLSFDRRKYMQCTRRIQPPVCDNGQGPTCVRGSVTLCYAVSRSADQRVWRGKIQICTLPINLCMHACKSLSKILSRSPEIRRLLRPRTAKQLSFTGFVFVLFWFGNVLQGRRRAICIAECQTVGKTTGLLSGFCASGQDATSMVMITMEICHFWSQSAQSSLTIS